MDYIKSNVTSKHKLVKVFAHPPNYSRDELLPEENVIIGKKRLLQEISKTYILQGGEVDSYQIPVIMGFNNFWDGIYRKQTIFALLRGIGDNFIKDDGKMFVVSAPPSITRQMDCRYPMAWISSRSPDLSSGLPKLLR